MTGVDHTAMFHVMGWVQPFVSMTLGNKYLLNGNVNDFTQILDLCLAEKSTLILGVPTVMNSFRTTLSSNPTKYAPLKGILKRALCGGSTPPNNLIKWFWDNWKVKVCQLWGMTEVLIGTIGQPMQRQKDINQSIKYQVLNNCTNACLPVIGYQYKIVDPENMNNELKHDGKEMSELLVSGPCVVNKYFRIDAQNKFHKGYLKTGDICSINNDKTHVSKDRSKDVIKSGGEWISSQDMENYIMALPQINKACVVAVKSEKYDERPIDLLMLRLN